MAIFGSFPIFSFNLVGSVNPLGHLNPIPTLIILQVMFDHDDLIYTIFFQVRLIHLCIVLLRESLRGIVKRYKELDSF